MLLHTDGATNTTTGAATTPAANTVVAPDITEATGMSLGQIAVECGLADQAHLCKLLLKIVGESPGMWRRARSSQPI